MKDKASMLGMGYEAPKVRGFSVSAGPGAPSVSEGTHTFTGETGGVKWAVHSLSLAETDSEGMSSSRRIGPQSTRWVTETYKTAAPDYLLVMSLPESLRKQVLPQANDATGKGFLASLAGKMATLAFGAYAASHFGKEQMAGTVLDQSHRLDWAPGEFSQRFMVFSSNESLARKILTAEVQGLLLAEKPLDLSMLVNPNGIMLSAPAFMIETEKIQALAKFGSELANRIRKA